MNGEEREWHPLHHLQLEVAVVLEVVGVEAEDQSRHERRGGRSGQAFDEDVGRETG